MSRAFELAQLASKVNVTDSDVTFADANLTVTAIAGAGTYGDSDTAVFLTSNDYATETYVLNNRVDSAGVSSIVAADVDSDYIQARQLAQDFTYGSLTGKPNVLDSAGVSSIVAADVDSEYVQARQTPQDFAYSSLTGKPNVLDSANISSIIAADVDSEYVQARQTAQDFAYSSLTGKPTILDSAGVTTIVDSDYISDRAPVGGSAGLFQIF